jgi:acetyl esterase
MPVDPLLQPLLDVIASMPPPPDDLSVAERRAQMEQGMGQAVLSLSEPAPAVASTVDHRVPVEGGEITVRVSTPLGEGPFPGLVYFHGGGFFMGTLDQFDIVCKELAAGAECVVVSVDYRLAPESKFPVAAEDAYVALLWTVEHADELGIDVSRLAVEGGSAGGNLAAVVSLMARDRGGPQLVLQVLEIPVTDLVNDYPSTVENGEGYILTRAAMEMFHGFYLPDPADGKEPYASPLLADDLSGLPPAVVMTMEFDPLRDCGELYAQRLSEAGVPTVAKRWAGHVHGSTMMTKLLPSAREYRTEVIGHLRKAFGNTTA